MHASCLMVEAVEKVGWNDTITPETTGMITTMITGQTWITFGIIT